MSSSPNGSIVRRRPTTLSIPSSPHCRPARPDRTPPHARPVGAAPRARPFPDRTIDWWLSGKDQTAVLALPPGEPPKWVQLDPDRRLSDPDIANNRQPMEWKTLLSRFGARYDFQSHEFEYNLSVLATPVHNRDRHLSLGLYRKEQSAGAKLEYRTDAWRSLVGDVHYELTGRIGWEKLRPEFGGEAASGRLEHSFRSGSRFSVYGTEEDPSTWLRKGHTAEWGPTFSYIKGVITARREWRLGPHESLATRLILGTGPTGFPRPVEACPWGHRRSPRVLEGGPSRPQHPPRHRRIPRARPRGRGPKPPRLCSSSTGCRWSSSGISGR